jgi:hypothetical protein
MLPNMHSWPANMIASQEMPAAEQVWNLKGDLREM